MSKVCMVTKKRTTFGNHVAHCNKKVKRSFQPNLHWKKFWVANENRFVRLLVSNKGIRIIDKKGIETVLKQIREQDKG